MFFTKPKGSLLYPQEPTVNKELMQINNGETQETIRMFNVPDNVS
jgi:hypothetical protein